MMAYLLYSTSRLIVQQIFAPKIDSVEQCLLNRPPLLVKPALNQLSGFDCTNSLVAFTVVGVMVVAIDVAVVVAAPDPIS